MENCTESSISFTELILIRENGYVDELLQKTNEILLDTLCANYLQVEEK